MSAMLLSQLFGCGQVQVQRDTKAEDKAIEMELDREEESLQFEKPILKSSVLIDLEGYQKLDTKKVIFQGENIADTFTVIEKQSKEVVYEGKVKTIGYDTETKEYISQGDFSSVREKGEYYIQVNPIGQSYTFEIKEDIYSGIYQKLQKELAYPNIKTGKFEEIGMIATQLLFCYEFYIKQTEEEQEASKLLDMAKDYCEVILSNQKKDGGIPCYRDQDEEAESDMCATMIGGAVLSHFAYVYQEYDTVFATECRKAAEKMYHFSTGLDKEDYSDLNYYLAAQLYRTTGQNTYHNIVKNENKADRDTNETQNDKSEWKLYGDVVYLMTAQRTDNQICTLLMEELLDYAEVLATESKKDYYLVCTKNQRVVSEILKNMFVLAVADYVIVSHEYLEILKEQIHYLNGRNNDYAMLTLDETQKSRLFFLSGNIQHREDSENRQ